MFNRSEKPQVSENRVADIEHVIKQHGEMLNALKDHVMEHLDHLTALNVALSLSLSQLDPHKRAYVEDTISLMTKEFKDRAHAARLRAVFEEKLHLNLSR